MNINSIISSKRITINTLLLYGILVSIVAFVCLSLHYPTDLKIIKVSLNEERMIVEIPYEDSLKLTHKDVIITSKKANDEIFRMDGTVAKIQTLGNGDLLVDIVPKVKLVICNEMIILSIHTRSQTLMGILFSKRSTK